MVGSFQDAWGLEVFGAMVAERVEEFWGQLRGGFGGEVVSGVRAIADACGCGWMQRG